MLTSNLIVSLSLLVPTIILGGFHRRNWGGWEKIDPPMAKKVFVFLLTFAIGCSITHSLIASAAFSALASLAYLNPFHSWGQNMGNDPTRPAWKCFLVMGLSYGAYTAAAAAAVVYLTGDVFYAQYGLHGFFVPLFYLLAKKLWPKDKQFWHTGARYNPDNGVLEQQWFLDGGFQALGEVAIGALLLSL